jgi:hypothetical protein
MDTDRPSKEILLGIRRPLVEEYAISDREAEIDNSPPGRGPQALPEISDCSSALHDHFGHTRRNRMKKMSSWLQQH